MNFNSVQSNLKNFQPSNFTQEKIVENLPMLIVLAVLVVFFYLLFFTNSVVLIGLGAAIGLGLDRVLMQVKKQRDRQEVYQVMNEKLNLHFLSLKLVNLEKLLFGKLPYSVFAQTLRESLQLSDEAYRFFLSQASQFEPHVTEQIFIYFEDLRNYLKKLQGTHFKELEILETQKQSFQQEITALSVLDSQLSPLGQSLSIARENLLNAQQKTLNLDAKLQLIKQKQLQELIAGYFQIKFRCLFCMILLNQSRTTTRSNAEASQYSPSLAHDKQRLHQEYYQELIPHINQLKAIGTDISWLTLPNMPVDIAKGIFDYFGWSSEFKSPS